MECVKLAVTYGTTVGIVRSVHCEDPVSEHGDEFEIDSNTYAAGDGDGVRMGCIVEIFEG